MFGNPTEIPGSMAEDNLTDLDCIPPNVHFSRIETVGQERKAVLQESPLVFAR